MNDVLTYRYNICIYCSLLNHVLFNRLVTNFNVCNFWCVDYVYINISLSYTAYICFGLNNVKITSSGKYMADLDVIRTQLKFDRTFASFVNFIFILCVCVYIYYVVWHE